MEKSSKFKDFFSRYLLPIAAILIVQAVDYLYFRYLHKGLKFPDYFPIMLLAIFLAWKYVARRTFGELFGLEKFNWPLIKKEFIIGFKYGALIVSLAVIAGIVSFQIKLAPNPEYFRALSISIFGYLIFIPISALYEELHYRGVYLSAFLKGNGKYFFVLVSSVVFVLVHLVIGNNPIFYSINIFLLGTVLALFRVRGKSVIACAGFHSAWNLVLISLAPVFGENTERYVEFSSATMVILALVLGYQIFLMNKTSKERRLPGS